MAKSSSADYSKYTFYAVLILAIIVIVGLVFQNRQDQFFTLTPEQAASIVNATQLETPPPASKPGKSQSSRQHWKKNFGRIRNANSSLGQPCLVPPPPEDVFGVWAVDPDTGEFFCDPTGTGAGSLYYTGEDTSSQNVEMFNESLVPEKSGTVNSPTTSVPTSTGGQTYY